MEGIKNNDKNNAPLIIIIVILLVAILGLCGYIFLNKDNNKENQSITENKNEQTENIQNNDNTSVDNNSSTNNSATDTKTNSVIIFDGSKVINSSVKNYTLACQGNAGIWIVVNENQKELKFSFTPFHVVEFYSLNWTGDRKDMHSSIIKFDRKITDVFFGAMGQDSSGDTLFILFEDGTVEYIPIVHALNNTQESVISYGKINGVSDVAKFTLSETSNGVTTLAIKNDGTFYDLWYTLEKTGNY